MRSWWRHDAKFTALDFGLLPRASARDHRGVGAAGQLRATANGGIRQIHVFQDMEQQEKYKPQSESPLFADGRSNRRPPFGTVARGHLKDDDVLHTGFVAPGDVHWQESLDDRWRLT